MEVCGGFTIITLTHLFERSFNSSFAGEFKPMKQIDVIRFASGDKAQTFIFSSYVRHRRVFLAKPDPYIFMSIKDICFGGRGGNIHTQPRILRLQLAKEKKKKKNIGLSDALLNPSL